MAGHLEDKVKEARDLKALNEYSNASIAMELLQGKEDMAYIQEALVGLAENRKINREHIERYIRAGLLNPQEGPRLVAEEYREYASILREMNLGTVYKHYSSTLPKVFDGDSGKAIGELFAQFKDEKYGDILKKYSKAEYIVEGVKKGVSFSREEIEAAKKIVKKYEKIVYALESLEKLKNRQPIAKIKDNVDSKSLVEKVNAPEEEALPMAA